MRNRTPLKIITLILFIISLTLGIIGYKYKKDHPEKLTYIVLGPKNGEEFLKIYKEANGELCFNTGCLGELYLIIKNYKTGKQTQLVSGNKDTNYLLINNDKIKLINLKERTELIIPEIPQGTYSLILEDGQTYNQNNLKYDALGIKFSSGQIKGFYNLKLKKIMYENQYKNITVIDKDYLINTEDEYITLLGLKEEKEIIKIPNDKNLILKGIETDNEKAYITLYNPQEKETKYQIYTLETAEKIGEMNGEFEKITKTNTKIIMLENQTIKIYNKDGKLEQTKEITASDKHNMIDNYYVTVKKGKLILIDIENDEEKELMTMNANAHLDKIYKDVQVKDEKTYQVLRIVAREIKDGSITKTYNIYFDIKTKDVEIIEE